MGSMNQLIATIGGPPQQILTAEEQESARQKPQLGREVIEQHRLANVQTRKDMLDDEIMRQALVKASQQAGDNHQAVPDLALRHFIAGGGSSKRAQAFISFLDTHQQNILKMKGEELQNAEKEHDQLAGLIGAVTQQKDPEMQSVAYRAMLPNLPPQLQQQLPKDFDPQMAPQLMQVLHVMEATMKTGKAQFMEASKKAEQATAERQAAAHELTAKTTAEKTQAEIPGIKAKSEIEQLTLNAMKNPGDPTALTAVVDKMGVKPDHARAIKAELEFAATHPTPDDPTGAKRIQQALQSAQSRIGQEESARIARENRPEPGTWQLQEDAAGNTIEYNTKTGQVRAAPDVKKAGTHAAAEKIAAPIRDAVAYADQYLSGGNFTGPGDEALLEKFFDLAKPSTGFRMNQAQLNMLQQSRSWMSGVSAKLRHATTGTWFSDDQRKQIAQTMKDLGKAKGQGGAEAAGATPQQIPTVGTVVRGYRFKGGDPSKRENWEKQ